MNLEVVTPPAADAVTADEIEQHLRLIEGDASEDVALASYLAAATERIEAATGRALIERTLLLTVDCFKHRLSLPAAPVSEIVSVKYDDTQGIERTLDPSLFSLHDKADAPYLVAAYGQEWPDTLSHPGAVRITFKAGYGATADTIPAPLRIAILQTLHDWHRFRGSIATTAFGELPDSARRTCQPFRRVWA